MKRKKEWMLGILVSGVAGFILYQGTRNLETSIAMSDRVVLMVLSWFADESSERFYEWYPMATYLIRKLAHVLEYAVFGFGIASYFRTKKENTVDVGVYSMLVLLIIAIADETFQKFVGRGSLVTDVVIDSVGGLLGVGGLMLWCRYRSRYTVRSSYAISMHTGLSQTKY